MKKRGNPDAAPPVAPSVAAEPRPDSPVPALLAGDEPAVAAAPSESMAGVVTVEPNEAIGASSEAPASSLLENDPAVAAAPSESMAGVVTVEPNGAPIEAPASSSAEPVARAAVRVLPRRPRLRASFHYDASDALNVELTLMDDRRELIHRIPLVVAPGGAIARIFEALLGVVTQAAVSAGVFGNRER